MNPDLANAPEAEVSEAAKRSGRKSGAQTPAEPSERKKGSKKNPKGSAGEKGGKITFSEKTTNALKEKVKEHNSKYSKKVTLGQLKKFIGEVLGLSAHLTVQICLDMDGRWLG